MMASWLAPPEALSAARPTALPGSGFQRVWLAECRRSLFPGKPAAESASHCWASDGLTTQSSAAQVGSSSVSAPQPGGGIVDQLVQTLVARTRLKGICNPDAGPILIGKIEDALVIGLAKPWCRVKLKRKSVIGCMTLGSSRLSRIGCPRGHLNTPYRGGWRTLSKNRVYRLSFSRPRSRQSQVKS